MNGCGSCQWSALATDIAGRLHFENLASRRRPSLPYRAVSCRGRCAVVRNGAFGLSIGAPTKPSPCCRTRRPDMKTKDVQANRLRTSGGCMNGSNSPIHSWLLGYADAAAAAASAARFLCKAACRGPSAPMNRSRSARNEQSGPSALPPGFRSAPCLQSPGRLLQT